MMDLLAQLLAAHKTPLQRKDSAGRAVKEKPIHKFVIGSHPHTVYMWLIGPDFEPGWTSSTLATRLGLTEEQVKTAIRTLRRAKILEASGRDGNYVLYRLVKDVEMYIDV